VEADRMTERSYSFRANAFTPERTFRLGPDALHWTSGRQEKRMVYSDVCEARFRSGFMRGEAAVKMRTMRRFQMRSRSGQSVTLSPLHYRGFRSWEDRSTSYDSFVGALQGQLHRRNPNLHVLTEPHWTLRLRNAVSHNVPALLGRFGNTLFGLFRIFGIDRTSRFASRLMRTVGPWLRAHHVARANLKAAFPDKSDPEIERVLQGVWDNFGRVVAEYAFLDQLSNYDPLNPVHKRIVIEPATLERMREFTTKSEPSLFFGAHIANWETSPLFSTAFGVDFTGVFRPFNSDALNDLIVKMRSRTKLIPARLGAAARIADALSQGSSIGALVDQHFMSGTNVVFFGRACKVNPLLAKLARKYEHPIYGVRAIRLPDGRLQGDLTEKLNPPRDRNGKIDVAATMQMITSIVERWVREHPEQWLWLHRRWR
jgi:KDO2-lipid IV(A) lauroyltransferase